MTVLLGVLAVAWGTWLIWREEEARLLPRLVVLLDRLVGLLEAQASRGEPQASTAAPDAGRATAAASDFVREVGALLDKGLSVPEVAERLGRTLGEVELARGLWRAQR